MEELHFDTKGAGKKIGGRPLFQVPSVSTLTIKLGVPHVLDLGVALYVHGSALASIMQELGGSSRNLFKTMAWTGQPSYCTGLHLGWKAFLLRRSAPGLDSLFIA